MKAARNFPRRLLPALLLPALLACGTLGIGGDGEDAPDLPEPAQPGETQTRRGESWLPQFKPPKINLWPFGEQPKPPAAPDLTHGVALVADPEAAAFYARARAFYAQFAGRRFNTLTMYREPAFREYFQNEQAHADYYADLASAMRAANISQQKAFALEVVELRVVGPGQAVVQTRVVGENDLPLRWWNAEMQREDKWERHQGAWLVVPGRF